MQLLVDMPIDTYGQNHRHAGLVFLLVLPSLLLDAPAPHQVQCN